MNDSYARPRALLGLANIQARDEAIRAALFRDVGHLDDHVNEVAIEAFSRTPLLPDEIQQVEKWLTRKTSSFRKNMIYLLLKQSDDALLASIQRLLKASDRLQRLAGLEIARQMIEKGRSTNPICDLIRQFNTTKRSEEEISLIKALLDEKPETVGLENVLGLIDPARRSAVITPKVCEGQYTAQSVSRIIESIVQLIDSHKDQIVEVVDYREQVQQMPLAQAANYGYLVYNREVKSVIPLIDLWEVWWVNCPETLRDADGYTSRGQELRFFKHLKM